MFFLRESGFLFIKTKAIAGPISHIAQRIQGRTDVVFIDLEPSNDKITMKESSIPYYDLEEIKALAYHFDKKLKLNSTFQESSKRSSQSLRSQSENKFNVLFVRTHLKYFHLN